MDEEKKIDDAVVLNHNTYGLIMDEEKKIDDTEVLMNDAEDDLEEDIEKIVSKSGVNIEAVLSENGFTKQYHQPAETQSVFGENLEEANIEVLIHDRQKELASIDNKITNYLCNNTFENSECMEGKVPDGVVNDKLLDESKKLKAAIMNNIKKLSDDDSLPDMPKGISRNYDQKVQEMELKMLEKMLASDDDDSLPEMPLGISRRYDTKGNNKVDSVGVKNIATVGLGTNLEVETFGKKVVASGKKLDDGNSNNKVDAVGVGFGKNLEVDTIGKKVEGSGKKFDDRNSNNKVDSVGVKNININNKVDAVGGKNMEIVVCGKNCGVDTIGKKVVGSGKKLDVGNSNNKVDAVGGKNMDIVGCGKNCEVDTIGKKFYVGNTMDNDIVANCTTVGIFESKNAPNKIVTTSAVENLIDYLLQRADKEKDWYQEKRQEYQYYSLKPFNIYICACTNLHFFLVNLIYDPTDNDGNVFKKVIIYDSLKRVTRATNNVPITRYMNKSPATEFLKKLQSFC